MDNDATMLGSGSPPTSTNAANFVRPVSFNFMEPRIYRPDPCGRIIAWKRSVDSPLTTNKRISLVTAIFSDRNAAEVVKRLSRDDVQSFVDVIDEVLPHSSTQEPTDLNPKFPVVMGRRWIA